MDPQSAAQPQQQVNLIDVPVTDESVSLNLIVQFLNVAQRRGAFSIAESAKIFECIKFFIQQQSPNGAPQGSLVGQEGELPLNG